jgi:hypothetical protein
VKSAYQNLILLQRPEPGMKLQHFVFNNIWKSDALSKIFVAIDAL